MNKCHVVYDNHLSCGRALRGIKWVWFESLGLGVMLLSWIVVIQHWFGFLREDTPETILGVSISISLKALHSCIHSERLYYMIYIWCLSNESLSLRGERSWSWPFNLTWLVNISFSHLSHSHPYTYIHTRIYWEELILIIQPYMMVMISFTQI